MQLAPREIQVLLEVVPEEKNKVSPLPIGSQIPPSFITLCPPPWTALGQDSLLPVH